jgi:hypothetical protein
MKIVNFFKGYEEVKNKVQLPTDIIGLWCLPDKFTLKKMHDNLYVNGLGGFDLGFYWASSAQSAPYAYEVRFSDGVTAYDSKNLSKKVRAIRVIISKQNDKVLNSIGEGGGYIYDVITQDNITFYYFESYPIDCINSISSNVNVGGCTDLNQNWGAGWSERNTLEMINQAGHITSASKLCNDLNI